MNIPGIFKYGSLVSLPLFSIITLALIRTVPNFSFKKHTVSKSINFISNHWWRLIFRLNFILKAFLDLGFSLYVMDRLRITLSSPTGLILIISSFLFGALAYFIEGKYTIIHGILIYSYLFLWVVGQILVANFIGNTYFSVFTAFFLSTSLIIGFGSLFQKRTNVIVQVLAMIIWYSWLLIFVSKFL